MSQSFSSCYDLLSSCGDPLIHIQLIYCGEAFREVLRSEYDFACAICGMKFVVDELHEAQAAHIVPKNKNGTDDPRNGLTLCRVHHWAFAAGLFTLTTEYNIVVSPLAQRADSRKFELRALPGAFPARSQLWMSPAASG